MTDSHIRASARPAWPVWIAGILVLAMVAVQVPRLASGWMPDNDDMMRLQQVRDLLAGQAWFDVDQHRLTTPEGGLMHWSRLPDLFLGAIILVLRPMLGQANAELVAITVWPMLLLAGVLAALATVMRRLGVGTSGQVTGLVFFALSSAIFNFWPGRIDHHGLVTLLVLVGLAALLDPHRSRRSAIILAACLAAMISVAIECLPYAGGLILALGLAWIVRGHLEVERLALFGLALAGFALAAFGLDAPGVSAARKACDAYGTVHLGGLVGGGLVIAGLGMFGGHLDTWIKRLIVGGLAGALVAALALSLNPACLNDPYASVSHEAQTAWLSAVDEARPLLSIWHNDRARFVSQFGFAFAGLAIAIGLLVRALRSQRLPAGTLALMMALSILAMTWQIRGLTFAHVFASIAGGWLVGFGLDRYFSSREPRALIMVMLAILFAAPSSWTFWSRPFVKPAGVSASGLALDSEDACRAPGAYRALSLPGDAGLVSPIDLGTLILSQTPYRAYAGPYHRNVASIEMATSVFASTPDTAHAMLIETGADYLLYCPGLAETVRYAGLHPEGLAAALERGNTPGWLHRETADTPGLGVVSVYQIDANSGVDP